MNYPEDENRVGDQITEEKTPSEPMIAELPPSEPAGPEEPEYIPPYYGGHDFGCRPVRRRRRGFGVLSLAVTLLIAFTLGGFSMYTLITSDIVERIVKSYESWRNPSAYPPYYSGDDPWDDDIRAPEDMPSVPTAPFVPVMNHPRINIVTVSDDPEDANYREVLSIPDIAELVKPSVVRIVRYMSADPTLGYAIGSGTIFSSDGYILTNAHVVANAFSIKVVLEDGTRYDGRVISLDNTADIAIVKIDARGLTPVEFGDPAQLRVGELAVAIGCPASEELQGTTTAGIISSTKRSIRVDSSGRVLELIQTDAAINPGNSGGPLLNQYGQVIGINTVKLNSSTYEGLCFAIPSHVIAPIVDELFEFGYVRGYPAIGITGQSVNINLPEDSAAPRGVQVATIDPNSDANGKLEVGDIILEVNGEEVLTVADINVIKNKLSVGDTIRLYVYRQGERLEVEVVLVDVHDLDN